MTNYYRHLQEVLENKLVAWSVTLTSVEGSSPASIGSKMLIIDGNDEVYGTIGGGSLEYDIIKFIKSNRPKTFLKKKYSLDNDQELGMICGGAIEVIIEAINVKEGINIYGAGHCSIALADILSKLNFAITVYDDRKEYLDTEKFNTETNLVHCNFDSLPKSVADSLYHVVMTYGHKHDYIVTEQLATLKYKYLGVMGSKLKAVELFDDLKRKFDVEDISNINCPIGIKIGSHSPYEIAVSIAAEIIQIYNKKNSIQ